MIQGNHGKNQMMDYIYMILKQFYPAQLTLMNYGQVSRQQEECINQQTLEKTGNYLLIICLTIL